MTKVQRCIFLYPYYNVSTHETARLRTYFNLFIEIPNNPYPLLITPCAKRGSLREAYYRGFHEVKKIRLYFKGFTRAHCELFIKILQSQNMRKNLLRRYFIRWILSSVQSKIEVHSISAL